MIVIIWLYFRSIRNKKFSFFPVGKLSFSFFCRLIFIEKYKKKSIKLMRIVWTLISFCHYFFFFEKMLAYVRARGKNEKRKRKKVIKKIFFFLFSFSSYKYLTKLKLSGGGEGERGGKFFLLFLTLTMFLFFFCCWKIFFAVF